MPMTRRMQALLSVGLVALASGSVLAQEGDPAAGEKVFNKCKACHVLDAETNRVGPYLHGVFGRPAGTAEGFNYSSAMKDSGIVWSERRSPNTSRTRRATFRATGWPSPG